MTTLPTPHTEGHDGEAHAGVDTSQDTSADVASVLQESQVMDVLHKLDQELVGLKSVKMRIREIAALLVIDRMRRSLELTAA